MPDTKTNPAAIPIRVRAIPGGVRLMLDAVARTVIEDVLDALLPTDADSDLYDRLVHLAELTPADRAMTPEHRMPYEELAADLAERAMTHTHLYGERGLQLAEQLAEGGVRALPVGHWAADAWRAYGAIKTEAVAAALSETLNGGAAA
ncbi:hypothetical protein [Streptomyces sp. NPDC008125]|uniref:hypothetical protein n=1 Tax=Streptomyces sp. NPDC008125 TaxID=3364811 RepID=UPI0036E5ABEE